MYIYNKILEQLSPKTYPNKSKLKKKVTPSVLYLYVHCQFKNEKKKKSKQKRKKTSPLRVAYLHSSNCSGEK